MLLVSGELNWDLTFLRRALAGDSSLALGGYVRERGGWQRARARRPAAGAPRPARRTCAARRWWCSTAIAPAEVGPDFERALAAFVRGGGGLLALGGPAPGLARLRGGRSVPISRSPRDGAAPARGGAPNRTPRRATCVAWDPDPARGERAWRVAAPLADVMPLRAGAGDRVLIGSAGPRAARRCCWRATSGAARRCS